MILSIILKKNINVGRKDKQKIDVKANNTLCFAK